MISKHNGAQETQITVYWGNNVCDFDRLLHQPHEATLLECLTWHAMSTLQNLASPERKEHVTAPIYGWLIDLRSPTLSRRSLRKIRWLQLTYSLVLWNFTSASRTELFPPCVFENRKENSKRHSLLSEKSSLILNKWHKMESRVHFKQGFLPQETSIPSLFREWQILEASRLVLVSGWPCKCIRLSSGHEKATVH